MPSFDYYLQEVEDSQGNVLSLAVLSLMLYGPMTAKPSSQLIECCGTMQGRQMMDHFLD